jgi:hypothetical protein
VRDCTGNLQAGQCARPARAYSTRKWSTTSVSVPTVERAPRWMDFWSTAMAGDSPSIESTSGFSMPPKNWRA